MTVKEMDPRAGGYISEEIGSPSYCRETGTVKSGEKLKAGSVLADDGGKLVFPAGTLDSDGALTETIKGVLYAPVDASATGADADVAGAVYSARGTVVRKDDLVMPAESSEGGEQAAIIAALGALNPPIIVR